MSAKIESLTTDVVTAIRRRVEAIESLAADTKGGAPIAPNFELGRFVSPEITPPRTATGCTIKLGTSLP